VVWLLVMVPSPTKLVRLDGFGGDLHTHFLGEKNEKLNSKILIDDSEVKLFNATESLSKQLSGIKDYKEVMKSLIDLKDLIDSFFDNVMVNADDEKLKSSRLALIRRIRALFLAVADISYLSS